MRSPLRLAVLLVLLCLAMTTRAGDFPEIPGWQPETEILQFNPEDLWRHINGAADQFIAFGFQELQTCELSSGDLLIALEIYDMTTPLNAFGIFKVEGSGPSTPLPLEVESALYPPYQGLMIKGRFYVKLEIYEGELDRSLATDIFSAIAGELEGGSGLPDEFSLLPVGGRVSGSEGWTRQSFLGLAALKNCLHARYTDSGEQSWLVFTILPGSGLTSLDIWNQLDKKWYPVTGHENMVTRKIPYKGEVGLILAPAGIFGVAEAPAENIPDLLQQLRGQFPK
jgi:hypothetical protein